MSAGHLRAAARLGAFLLAAGTSLAMAQTPARFGNVDDARIANAASEPQNWLTPGGGWLEQNYSGLDQVNVDTVSRLKRLGHSISTPCASRNPSPSWSMASVCDGGLEPCLCAGCQDRKAAVAFRSSVPGHVGIRAAAMSIIAAWRSTRAGASGHAGWPYDGARGPDAQGDLVHPDFSHQRRIYHHRRAPRLSRQGGDRQCRGDFGVRGFLSAYNINTGRQVWKFLSDPARSKEGPGSRSSDGVQKMMADTWAGQWYKHGGGASPWNTIVL